MDWQTIAVALVVAAALLYVARRALARLRSFARTGGASSSSCATGCGKCGEETKAQTTAGPALVQISRPGGPPK